MSDRPNALPCIRCGKQLKQCFGSLEEGAVDVTFENQPYNGTAFYTGGHYGSTVFDELLGTTIEINVCDVCLLDAAKEQRVLYYRRLQKTESADRQFWVPDVDEEHVREIDRREHGGSVK